MTSENHTDILLALETIMQQRKSQSPDTSYVASLYSKGINKVLEKVGEESTELVIAAKDFSTKDTQSRQAVVGEMADLWFHTMVLFAHLDIPLSDVFSELARRQGLSGLEEKASRQPDQP